MKYFIKDFNFLKLILASIGSILVIASLSNWAINHYMLLVAIGWFLISYAIALKRDGESLSDLEPTRFMRMIIAYFFVVIGSILLRYHRMKGGINININPNNKYALIVFLGILFYVISKAIMMIVELNLNNMSQYVTILSISSLIIGKTINSIASNPLLYRLSLAYYILGFLTFIINLSYNPVEKLASPIHLVDNNDMNKIF